MGIGSTGPLGNRIGHAGPSVQARLPADLVPLDRPAPVAEGDRLRVIKDRDQGPARPTGQGEPGTGETLHGRLVRNPLDGSLGDPCRLRDLPQSNTKLPEDLHLVAFHGIALPPPPVGDRPHDGPASRGEFHLRARRVRGVPDSAVREASEFLELRFCAWFVMKEVVGVETQPDLKNEELYPDFKCIGVGVVWLH